MRKVLLPLAAAASVLAVASPASAQVYGNLAPGYGYGQQAYSYGNAYGYGYGNFQAQLQQVRNQAYYLMRQGRLTRAESRDLNRDIRNAERAMYRTSRYGLSPYEARNMQTRISNLQFELRRYADYDGRRYGYRGY